MDFLRIILRGFYELFLRNFNVFFYVFFTYAINLRIFTCIRKSRIFCMIGRVSENLGKGPFVDKRDRMGVPIGLRPGTGSLLGYLFCFTPLPLRYFSQLSLSVVVS